MLGRLTHYAFDAVLVSTVFAGVKRTSGFTVDSNAFPEPAKPFADTFLSVGETIFDFVQATAVNSQYFKRTSK